MKYLQIPEGATSLMLAFSGDMSKMDDEQREVWKRLEEAAKSALAQQLGEEKPMKEFEICSLIDDKQKDETEPSSAEATREASAQALREQKEKVDPGIERAHDQGGPDGADFKEACKEMVGEDQKIFHHLVKAVKEDHGITHSIRYTQESFAVEMKRIFEEEIMALWTAGTAEYAHAGHSPFANFERGAKEMGIDRKQVLWVYAMKHKDGIAAALKGHTSQREDIRGRINDLIVYLLLMRGIFNEECGNTGNFGLGDLEA